MKEQGSRPVVSLTLKGAQSLKFEVMMDLLRGLLQNLYGDYRYLLEHPGVLEEERQFYHRAKHMEEFHRGHE